MKTRTIIDFSLERPRQQFADSIGCPPALLECLLASSDRSEFYRTFPRAKAGGGTREIWVADGPLATVHDSMMRRLRDYATFQKFAYPGQYAYGFAPMRGVRDRAKPHLGHRLLLTMDIAAFFDSIPTCSLVRELATEFQIASQSAAWIGTIATVRDSLKQGLVSSPFLADAFCMRMDRELAAVAANVGAKYTRYADDLAFSSDQELPTAAAIANILGRFGFTPAPEKTRTKVRGQAQFVTGICIQDSSMPRAPRKLKRRLRQELHFAERFGIDDHAAHISKGPTGGLDSQYVVNSIFGRLSYLRGIEPTEKTRTMTKKWSDLLATEGREYIPKALPRLWHGLAAISGAQTATDPAENQERRSVLLVLDESLVGNQTLLGCAICFEPTFARSALANLRVRLLADAFLPGNTEHWSRKGFYLSDDHGQVRQEVVSLIAKLPFWMVIGKARDDGSPNISADAYLRLLNKIVIPLLANRQQWSIEIAFDQHDYLPLEQLKASLSASIAELYSGYPETLRPQIASIGKVAGSGEECVAIVDYVLGLYRDRTTKPNLDASFKQFEQVRPRIVVVYDETRDAWLGRREYLGVL